MVCAALPGTGCGMQLVRLVRSGSQAVAAGAAVGASGLGTLQSVVSTAAHCLVRSPGWAMAESSAPKQTGCGMRMRWKMQFFLFVEHGNYHPEYR